jgi:hypothetical protein
MPAVENDSIGIKNVLHPVSIGVLRLLCGEATTFQVPRQNHRTAFRRGALPASSESFLVISMTYGQWPNLTPHIEAIPINALSKHRVRDLYVGAEEEIT